MSLNLWIFLSFFLVCVGWSYRWIMSLMAAWDLPFLGDSTISCSWVNFTSDHLFPRRCCLLCLGWLYFLFLHSRPAESCFKSTCVVKCLLITFLLEKNCFQNFHCSSSFIIMIINVFLSQSINSQVEDYSLSLPCSCEYHTWCFINTWCMNNSWGLLHQLSQILLEHFHSEQHILSLLNFKRALALNSLRCFNCLPATARELRCPTSVNNGFCLNLARQMLGRHLYDYANYLIQ